MFERIKKISRIWKMLGRTYDAAETTRHNRKHWAKADGADADALIEPRLSTLRNRARYEIRNNSIAKGIVLTYTNEVVGSGPRLLMQTGNAGFDDEIESGFEAWAKNPDAAGLLDLGAMLRLMVYQLLECGEAIFVSQNGPAAGNVKLKYLMIEPDRLATPLGMDPEKVRQGIEVDDLGRPLFYYFLKRHPGSAYMGSTLGENSCNKIPAARVIHVFRKERPGQTRGVPWLTPSLPLFAQLRRYTLAMIRAAETAANISGVVQTNSPDVMVADVADLDAIEMEANSFLTMPAGWGAEQFKAENPTATYKEFREQIIGETGRPLNMPLNVTAANSAGYNFASGRMDRLSFEKEKAVVRDWIGGIVIDRILGGFIAEYSNLPASRLYFPIVQYSHAWAWPGAEHVDEAKSATAKKTRLETGDTTYADECAAAGKDWKKVFIQRAKENELAEELGLPLPHSSPSPVKTENEDDEKDDEEKDDEEKDDEEKDEKVA